MGTDPQRVVAAFLAAVEVQEDSERQAILDRECGDDRVLRKQVCALLSPEVTVSTATPEPRGDTSQTEGHGIIVFKKEPTATPNVQQGDKSDGGKRTNLNFLEPTSKPGFIGRLRHYDVLDVIGRGGFGVVLKALDDKLQRIVAIKVLPLEMALEAGAQKRFLREARAAGAIHHENVVQVYAVEEKPVHFLVMEFIPGDSLQQRIERDGPFSVEDTLLFGTQLARGLEAAHNARLVHQDIKPANILIESEPEPRVKITDFGLARGAKDDSLTQTGWILGTPMFMAPEQAYGYVVDHRADLFSLGSVLYTMLSGKPPFTEGTADIVMRSVTKDVPPPLKDLVPAVPQWLCDIIAKLHAKDPNERLQSAGEVAALLENRQSPKEEPESSLFVEKSPIQTDTLPRSHGRRYVAAIAMLAVLILGVMGASGLFHTAEPAVNDSPAESTTENSEQQSESVKQTAALPLNRFANSLGMEFTLIPKGKSWLGGGAGKPGKKEIDVSIDFFMGVYEVTREEWEKVMGPGKNASEFSRNGKQEAAVRTISDADLKRFPIDGVSWNDCQEFATRLNQTITDEGWFYRLPTSNEWEYACRGGPMASREESRFDYYQDDSTNTLPPGKANFDASGLNRPCKVGSYPPNRLGLYDMHGNVFEYCNDRLADKGNRLRFLVGGGWMDNAGFCSAEHRNIGDPRGAYTGGGLRLVRVPTKGVPVVVRVVKE